MHPFAPALLALLLLTPQDARVEAWSEDLFFLVERFDALHPTPYHGVPREEFEETVSVLYERLPELTDDQVIVELMIGPADSPRIWPRVWRLLTAKCSKTSMLMLLAARVSAPGLVVSPTGRPPRVTDSWTWTGFHEAFERMARRSIVLDLVP